MHLILFIMFIQLFSCTKPLIQNDKLPKNEKIIISKHY
ncbi:hypothetical protein LDG_8921 [Legionella drancourtii LLAP12]|uniref:Uncharacterized protein n=1 Tax=Legionella drancourtii LLAP12 TaxID=658187 RepID=G9EUC8_9GAMM|nr:hypothetical protein LDG_8921 [Legionella drancourtii LLAP12]